MLTLHDGNNGEKLELLTAAIEDAIDGADLRALPESTLRDLEMRLATVCSVLGGERMMQDDPYREEHQAEEFGGEEGWR